MHHLRQYNSLTLRYPSLTAGCCAVFFWRSSPLVLTDISKLSIERLEAVISLTKTVIDENENIRICSSVQHARQAGITKYKLNLCRDQTHSWSSGYSLGPSGLGRWFKSGVRHLQCLRTVSPRGRGGELGRPPEQRLLLGYVHLFFRDL